MTEEKKTEKKEEKKEEKKVEEKKEEKKPKVAPKPKEIPSEARARREYVPASTKQAVNVCRFIKGKKISYVIPYLEDVIKKKKAIPFVRHKRHVSHRKGPMTAGRFPIKATKYVLELVKSAKANAEYLGLSDSLVIEKAIPNRAFSKASKRGRFTHIEITVKEKEEKKKKEKPKKEKEVKK